MARRRRRHNIQTWSVWITLAALAWSGGAAAQSSFENVLSAVVRIRAEIPADARTAHTLGMQREGSGVVIDDDGLVLTIGYLMLEAMSITVYGAEGKPVLAEYVAYDHESGFGLVRSKESLGVRAVRLGASNQLAEQTPVLVVSHGGVVGVRRAFVSSRREFAGYWEYLLENAIFTVPPHPLWAGAALIGSDGKLLGIGSLIVEETIDDQVKMPGNMFVPIDLLKPILADLLTDGRRSGARRPWLGMFSKSVPGGAMVIRVAPEGPAQRAGILPGDIVIGVGADPVSDLPDLYRKIWARGNAEARVPLKVRRGSEALDVIVTSGDRESYLRLKPTY